MFRTLFARHFRKQGEEHRRPRQPRSSCRVQAQRTSTADMEMAEELNHQRASWNPLRCDGTELQPQTLLIAKLLALVFWRFGLWSSLPDPYNPFIPALEALRSPVYVTVLKTILMAAFLCI